MVAPRANFQVFFFYSRILEDDPASYCRLVTFQGWTVVKLQVGIYPTFWKVYTPWNPINTHQKKMAVNGVDGFFFGPPIIPSGSLPGFRSIFPPPSPHQRPAQNIQRLRYNAPSLCLNRRGQRWASSQWRWDAILTLRLELLGSKVSRSVGCFTQIKIPFYKYRWDYLPLILTCY